MDVVFGFVFYYGFSGVLGCLRSFGFGCRWIKGTLAANIARPSQQDMLLVVTAVAHWHRLLMTCRGCDLGSEG